MRSAWPPALDHAVQQPRAITRLASGWVRASEESKCAIVWYKKFDRIDRDLLWVYVTDRFGGYIYKEAQSEPKETSISGSRLYYGNRYIMLPHNTRVVEGGPKEFDQGLLSRSV